MDRVESKIPFVGLHAHSVVGSPFDGFGYPQEHMDFAYQNGMNALALTDHGNMNGTSYQVLHAKKMKAEGKNFKPIFGVEAYFVPCIKQWRDNYEQAKLDKKKAKELASDDGKVSAENEDSKQKSKDKISRRMHLVLIALNQTGLNNIYKMVSLSHQGDNFYRNPRVDYAMLKEYGEGVMASSACMGGVYAGDYWENKDEGREAVLNAMRETTRRMQDCLGDRWFGELQWHASADQHHINQYVIDMHKELGIQLISTADSHYPNPDAWKDRELYKRLQWLNIPEQKRPDWLPFELPADIDEVGHELYPKNGDQMWAAYKKYSEMCEVVYDDDIVYDSIVRTHWIANELIEDFMPDDTVRLPGFVVPEGASANSTLVKQCITGLKDLGLATNDEYVDRLKHELTVINGRGFSKYFLTMKAIADVANESMLSGPGRGSAAGSLVAYVLGITQVDPIKYGLLFSRFLRSDATDYPDIDYDVSDAFGLKEILAEKWGNTTVVPISNYNTLQLRSLIKDISKYYKVPFVEVNAVTSKMVREATPKAKADHGIKAGVYVPTFQEVMKYSYSLVKFLEKYPHIKTHVEALFGQTRSTSRHAGGVVIGENLDQYMPLICSGGVVQTPWSEGMNVRHLEPLGFIKFDLLGLSTLEMIQSAVGHILKREKGIDNPTFEDIKKFYNENLHPDVIDLNDKKVYKNIFHKGKFAGIFQFTNTGAQKLSMKSKPKDIIDISAITSIYRPGPLSANVDKLYVKAKRARSGEYLHEIIKEVTEETFGFLIFQEQIALLAHKLGDGISLEEGNKLRKLLTKKGSGKGHEEKDSIHDRFITGCVKNGIPSSDAEKLWQKFEYFSGYGFNKSHAVSYSILSFQCAWLFNYYPACWMAAFLDKEPESRKEAAIGLAQKYGFYIEHININTSTEKWEIGEDNKTLIQPFSSIKGLGDKAIEQIMANRPFEKIEDILFNKDIVHAKLNKRALDVLCRSGAMDAIVDDRFKGCKHFWMACIQDKPKSPKKLTENIDKYAPEEDFTSEEKIDYVSTLTGIFPFDLVLTRQIREAIHKHEVPPLGEWDSDLEVAWFVPREVISKKTKNGKTYWIVKVLDETSTMTSIKCWGIKDDDTIHLNRPYIAKLDHSEDWGFSTRSIRHNFKLLG